MRRRFSWVLAGLFLAGSVASVPSAEGQSKRRWEEQEGAEADLGGKKETGLDEGLKEDLTRQKVEERAERPALKFDQFRRGVEVQVAAKRREQIETLTRLLDLGASKAETPDLLFRLAELYWEEAKFHSFEAHAKDDEIIAAKGDRRRIAALKKEQEALRERSDRYRLEAVQRYRQIVADHPDYPRLDEVLYSLGSNLWEQEKRKSALRFYEVLIKRFPDSNYVPDAWLAAGEYHFDEGDVSKALKAYEKAASFPESKVYGFALYKQGWCYYNLGEWTRAMDLFKAVIFYGELSSATGGQNKIALIREARRDYVLAFSHVGDPRNAPAEFASVGGDMAPKMLRSLGNLYYDEGQDKEAIVTYVNLIESAPLSPAAPGYQARVVDAAQRLGNKPYTAKQARLLVRRFNEVEEAGVVKTDKEKEDLEEARSFAEKTLRTLAVSWHAEGKKTRDHQTFLYAREMYRDYVELFPDGKHAYDIHFYYGELLYHLEDWAPAADQYTAALQVDIDRIEGRRTDEEGRREKPGKFLTDAAFNAILSYEEVVKRFEETEQRPDAPATQQLEIPGPKQALLDACQRYLTYVPKGDKRVEVAYKAANIYYRYNHFEQAVERFAAIAMDNPGHELAEYSANLVIDSFNLLDQPDKVNEWARRFYAIPTLAKGSFRAELLDYIEDSALTMIERQSAAGKHAEAAQAYEAFVREFPRSDRADTALYNASVSWSKARDLDKALGLRARIIREYPDSPLVPQAIYTTAQGYESVVRYDEAARYYETYAERWAAQSSGRGARGGKKKASFEESKAQEALFNAGVLREAVGQYALARNDRLAYVKHWPAGKDASKLFRSVSDLLAKEGKVVGASRHLDAWLEKYARNDADEELKVRQRQAELLVSAGPKYRSQAERKYAEIRATWERLGSRRSKVDEGRLAVAEAQLRSLDDDARAFQGLTLEYPWQEGIPARKLASTMERAQAMVISAQEEGREDFTPKEIALIREAQRIKPRLERGIAVADKGFKASIQRKAAALEKLTTAYAEVVKYQQAEPALCALEAMGDAYLHFVETLKEAPLPPYMAGEEQVAMFRDLMSQEALPVEDKAVEAYATAVEKSRELMAYSACAQRSLEALQTLRPDAHPAIAEAILPLRGDRQFAQSGFLVSAIEAVPETAEAAPALSADAQAQVPEPRRSRRRAKGVRPVSQPTGGRDAGEPVYSEPDDEELLR